MSILKIWFDRFMDGQAGPVDFSNSRRSEANSSEPLRTVSREAPTPLPGTDAAWRFAGNEIEFKRFNAE
jgi:hypothetical protein